ncbi:hypothetical protein BDQ17DRAFT_1322317 [Cyathus striatus]|nr:hypothetical protein BDQ17DRAFT_1322317 [Cyathus striatus]
MNGAAESAHMFRLLRCTQIISTLITLHDHVCTVDAEKKRWSSSKILFIAIQMLFCISFEAITKCSITCNIIIPSGTCSLIYLCQEVSATVTIVIYRVKNSSVIVKDLHGTAMCLLIHGRINSSLAESTYWVTIILFETIILSLTLWKFMFDIRHTPALRRSSLSRLLVRDNILYFISAFTLYLSVGVASWVFKTVTQNLFWFKIHAYYLT